MAYNQETERELIPVQRAVKKLAQSGKALENGDLKAVSDALGYAAVHTC